MTPGDFAARWQAVSSQVMRTCRYALSDPALCADVAQQVAIRAWRGSASFRGDCPFSLWVLKITRNEINRAVRRLARQRIRETPLANVPEESPHLVANSVVLEPGLRGEGLPSLIARAGAAGELAAQEAQCVLARLTHPQSSWDDIGALLGISGAHCAVLHCRAIPKFRAYLLVNHRDQIAPRATLVEAMHRAVRDSEQPLTAAEEAAFRRIVVEGDDTPSARRNLGALRTACAKVIRHVPYAAEFLAMS